MSQLAVAWQGRLLEPLLQHRLLQDHVLHPRVHLELQLHRLHLERGDVVH